MDVHYLIVSEKSPTANVASPKAASSNQREQGEPDGLSLMMVVEEQL